MGRGWLPVDARRPGSLGYDESHRYLAQTAPARRDHEHGVKVGLDVRRNALGELRHEVDLLVEPQEREVAARDELDRNARLRSDLE